MALLPRINQMKFGIIDQNYMNTLAQRSDEFANMEKELSHVIAQTSLKSTDNFLARIDPSTTSGQANGGFPVSSQNGIPQNFPIAWLYQFTRIDFKLLPTFVNSDTTTPDAAHSGALYTEQFYIDPKTGLNTQTSEEVDSMFDRGDIGQGNGGIGIGHLQGYCYNLAEISNIMTDPIIFGVNISSDDFDSGFEPQPVPAGSIVRLQRVLDEYGHQHYTFERQGTFDGTCTTL